MVNSASSFYAWYIAMGIPPGSLMLEASVVNQSSFFSLHSVYKAIHTAQCHQYLNTFVTMLLQDLG